MVDVDQTKFCFSVQIMKRKSSLSAMISVKKLFLFLFIGTAGLMILKFAKLNRNPLIFSSTESNSTTTVIDENFTASIIYENFTCTTWKDFSYIRPGHYHECLQWHANGNFWPDEAIRHTAHKHLLNSSSLIIEVGGNRGHDMVKFIKFHNLSIISYEPLVPMWKALTEQFKSNPKIEIHPYGLGNHARKVLVELADSGNAGTSIFRPLSATNSTLIEEIELLDVVQAIQHIRKTRTKNGMIDMISINCEGCEFEIIPALILNNLTQYFRILQFASHLFVPDGSCIYCQIEQGLERTHETLFHYKKVWEGWVLKK